jgi:hypothetical protein
MLSADVISCLWDFEWGNGFISDGCLSCHGQLGECMAIDCTIACELNDEWCNSCVEENCSDDFNECTGYAIGCTDEDSCNYDSAANLDYGTCDYAPVNFDCNGDCTVDTDCAGVCGGSFIYDGNFVFDGNGSTCACVDGDFNEDDDVSIADIVLMVSHVLQY